MTNTASKLSSGKKTRIIIIDDHPIVRHGLAQLIDLQDDMHVCGEADGAADGWELVKSDEPDLVIVDVSLEGTSGIEFVKSVSRRMPNLRLLVLSMHDENLYAERAIRSGAQGYVMKQAATDTLITAIHQVMKGEIYLSERMKSKMLTKIMKGESEYERSESSLSCLTNRELEVFQMIGKGLGTSKIAKRLNLSVKTIETYRQNLKQKLNLNNSSELVRYAIHWTKNDDI